MHCSPVSVVLQCKLVSDWQLKNGDHRRAKGFTAVEEEIWFCSFYTHDTVSAVL